jgi:hypothetical protein
MPLEKSPGRTRKPRRPRGCRGNGPDEDCRGGSGDDPDERNPAPITCDSVARHDGGSHRRRQADDISYIGLSRRTKSSCG